MSYFKIYLTQDNRVAILSLGECDEIDYERSRFLSYQRFETENEAIEYLQANEYKLPKHVQNPYSSRNTNILDF